MVPEKPLPPYFPDEQKRREGDKKRGGGVEDCPPG